MGGSRARADRARPRHTTQVGAGVGRAQLQVGDPQPGVKRRPPGPRQARRHQRHNQWRRRDAQTPTSPREAGPQQALEPQGHAQRARAEAGKLARRRHRGRRPHGGPGASRRQRQGRVAAQVLRYRREQKRAMVDLLAGALGHVRAKSPTTRKRVDGEGLDRSSRPERGRRQPPKHKRARGRSVNRWDQSDIGGAQEATGCWKTDQGPAYSSAARARVASLEIAASCASSGGKKAASRPSPQRGP